MPDSARRYTLCFSHKQYIMEVQPAMPMMWSKESLKGKMKLMVFSLIPVVLLFGCAEVFASLTIHREIATRQDPTTGLDVYTMRIGQFPWSRSSTTSLNSLGLPDEEFSNIGSKGDCIHVVVAGDSFVFGDGVDQDSSFFQLVKRWTAERNPDQCIRFFNIAERSTTIGQQAQQIRQTLELLDPDIVILEQFQNDLTDLTKSEFTASEMPISLGPAGKWTTVRQRLRAFNLKLIRLLSYHAFGFMITHNVRYDVLRHWSVLADSSNHEAAERLMRIYHELYVSVATELTGRGILFGVVIIPSKFDLLAGRFPEESYFIAEAEKQDVPYLPLFATFDANRSPFMYLMYDGHLNEFGNQVVATAIYDWLFASEPVPFPVLRTGGRK